jgi:CubicO group peptidase (beta-lactamase class C family)
MRLLFSTFSLVLILASFSCRQKKDAPPGGRLVARLDSLFGAVPDFSGVVLVAEKGRPFYYKAFGFRNFETREPLDTGAVFELASVSKQFTAMVIMMLAEEGKLAYDDAIEKYIPGLPYPGISIRHLLNHTSGLPDYQAVMDQYWDKTKVAGNDDNIEYLKRYKPARRFEPGEKYEYSNTGYMLLASIAEKTTGRDFIELCHERIFTPLAMRSTDIRTREAKQALPRMAWGHLYVAEKQRYIHADSFPAFNYAIWLGNRKGPGRVSATASDLLRWDQALYTERLVKKETLAQAFRPAILNDGSPTAYGFGWMTGKDTGNGAVVMHTGDNPGYKTKIVRYLDKHRTVILLCNNAHAEYEKIVRRVEDLTAGHWRN